METIVVMVAEGDLARGQYVQHSEKYILLHEILCDVVIKYT